MTYFYLAAAALVAAALALLLRLWWRSGRRVVGADFLPALNAAIHRDRLAELERDHLNGTLSDAGLAEAVRVSRTMSGDPVTGCSIVEEAGRWVLYLDVVFADGAVRHRVQTYHTRAQAEVAARYVHAAAERDLRPDWGQPT